MSSTPKTDAAKVTVDVAYVGHDGLSSYPKKYVEVEFAEKLEIALDEAQKIINLAQLNKAKIVDEQVFEKLKKENLAMRAWIRKHGQMMDTCTYGILKEVCSDCNCGRKK